MIKAVDGNVLNVVQEWEGYITEVHETGFTASLLDITAGDAHEGEEVTMPLKEVPPADLDNVQVGRLFRWVIGYQLLPDGSKKHASQLVFPDVPPMSAKDMAEGRAWADKIGQRLTG